MQASDGSISICVAVRNGADYLAEAIGSVRDQSRPARDIIVVDDGSTDATAEIAAAIPGVRVISQANAGVAAARNTGLAAATGDYIVFLDHDDRMLPDALAVNGARLDADPALGFVGGRSRVIDARGNPVASVLDDAPVLPCSYETLLRGAAFVPPSTVLFRRRALQAVGGSDAAMRSGCEDLDLYLKVARAFPVVRHGEVLVEYRRHGTNFSSKSLEMFLASRDLLERQRAICRDDPQLLDAISAGIAHWAEVYGTGMVGRGIGDLRRGSLTRGLQALWLALRYHPAAYRGYARHRLTR